MFGIPGDSITAIVSGVLYMSNMKPGPLLFTNNPQNVDAVYLLCIVADGSLLAFVERPVAATLCGLTLAVWFLPLLMRRLRRLAGA